MGNILSYLRLNGDRTLAEMPMCEADVLALALLSYADLSGAVPPASSEASIPLIDAYAVYSERQHPSDKYTHYADAVLRAMATSRRFSGAFVSKFASITDTDIATQFAALQIEPENGVYYISYRGTDDSIVGWREDFRMVYEITPAQHMAAAYLKDALRPRRSYYLVGHSKGGMLAYYAASQCPSEYRHQIKAVYSLDGPGLSRDLVPAGDVQWVDDITTRILPGYSIVGTIFLYGREAALIESDAKALLQHDPSTWQIEENGTLRRIAEREKESEFYIRTLAQWINTTTMYQRRVFTREFFDALDSSGAVTVTELAQSGISGFNNVLASMIQAGPRTRPVVIKLMQALANNLAPASFSSVLRGRALRGSATLHLRPGQQEPDNT